MEMLGFALLVAVSFISSIIGTMIGTAMLILPPTMIFLGIPVHTAIATSRFSLLGVGIGNITRFSLKNRIQRKYVVPFALAGVIGAVFGASLLTKINEETLKKIIGIFMLIVSLLIFFEGKIKPKKARQKITIRHYFLSILSGIFIGAYIGVIGGGGATVIIFLLILIYGLSFKDAVVNQKAVTLPISIITTIIFVYQGLIEYRLGLPLLIINIIGGWIGAGLMLKFRNIWLKRILVPVIIIMAIRLIFF